MQGDPEVIEILNEVLTNELTAVNQYFLHARMQKNWGFTKLGDYTYGESIDEMKHADLLIERILFLDGHPNVQRLDPVRIGETVTEQLSADLAVEVHAMEALRRGIVVCQDRADTVSRLLLEQILTSEEEHVDYLETQISLVETLGEQQYLQLQVEPGGH
ncbi:MAG TPA: bacterioferritin [Mycobacteriales bacterium]|nr:bacterioferritin [Mycobacteriales bacterium]